MNYYEMIGNLNNKRGFLSIVVVVLAIIDLLLALVESNMFFISFSLFIVSILALLVNNNKINKVFNQAFEEYREHMIELTNEEYVDSINKKTFFTAVDTSSKTKMVAIYDAKLELSNEQFIDMLLARTKFGYEDFDTEQLFNDNFDIKGYVNKQIADLYNMKKVNTTK